MSIVMFLFNLTAGVYTVTKDINLTCLQYALSNKGVQLPIVVIDNLSEADVDRWFRFYGSPLVVSWDNTVEEGLWRRTQDEKNRCESGWQSEDDMRRRMVHYQHKFLLIERKGGIPCLALTSVYLWWHICFPKDEISVYEDQIYAGLQLGGWRKLFTFGDEKLFCNGDLYLGIKRRKPSNNAYDMDQCRVFPDDYRIMEVTVFSSGGERSEDFLRKPWGVLASGIREKDVRGSPRINDWEAIEKILPAQVEVGCGPSVEAGVPPLHFLHEVYCVTDKQTGLFVLDPYRDSLIRCIAECPLESLLLFSEMHKRCFLANPTKFHAALKRLHDSGYIVGPVITNNFDGLLKRVGLPELLVRRYEDVHIIPNIEFHPSAKSLLVIGSHADRRRIQSAARKKGLIVAYIDPEGFGGSGDHDEFSPYLLESPQDGDYLFRMPATAAIEKIASKVL